MMITLRDVEVGEQIRQDALRRAEHERLLLEVEEAARVERVPIYGWLFSMIGQWLIRSGEFLQRRYSYA